MTEGGEPVEIDDKFKTDSDRSSATYVDEGTKWLRRSRSSKRRPTTKRPHVVSSASSENKIISPAKHRVRDSSSLLTPVQIDEMFPTQISTDKEEEEDEESVSSSSSSVFSSSLCVTATSFKNFYVQATIHDTGGVRLVLMSSSKVAYTLNATLTDADRLLLNLERTRRHRKNRRQVLAPWLPKLCTSHNLLCACTSSGSIYFISSDYRSYRFEYGTSVCDFAMSRSTFFGGDKESFVLVLVPRNSRHIEVYRLVDSIVGEDDS